MADKISESKKRKGIQRLNIKVTGYLTHERLQLLNKYKGIVANSEFDGYCFPDYEGNIKLKSFNPMMGGKTYFSIRNEMELIKLINNNSYKTLHKYEKSIQQRHGNDESY